MNKPELNLNKLTGVGLKPVPTTIQVITIHCIFKHQAKKTLYKNFAKKTFLYI